MMMSFPPKRFPRWRFDSAADLLRPGFGLRGFRRGLSAAPSALATAISKAEGYGVPGTVPTVANNPGDLELGDIGYGVTVAAGGEKITNFPDAASGYAALESQINKIATGTSSAGYQPGWSISQVGNLYSGGSSAWASNVASTLGVSPDTPFASVATGVPAGGSISDGSDVSLVDSSSVAEFPSAMVSAPSGDNTGLILAGVLAAGLGLYLFL
jgi:hypothetical protein